MSAIRYLARYRQPVRRDWQLFLSVFPLIIPLARLAAWLRFWAYCFLTSRGLAGAEYYVCP